MLCTGVVGYPRRCISLLGDGFWVWDASGEISLSTGCWAAPIWEAKPCSRNSAAVLGRAQIHPVVNKTLSLGNQESVKVPVRAGKEPWLEIGQLFSPRSAGDLELPQPLLVFH